MLFAHGMRAGLALAVLLACAPEALPGQSPPAGIEDAVRAPGPQASKAFPHAEAARRNPNICPVCGESWDKDVHRSCLRSVTPEQQEAHCPSCGLDFFIERRLVRVEGDQIDRDLCPHPPPGAPATPDLAICPRCGFASVRRVFRLPDEPRLPAEQQAWIRREITPGTREAFQALIGRMHPDHRPGPEELYTIFDANAPRRLALSDEQAALLPERIVETGAPDTLRCSNAYRFADRFLSDRNPLVCARLAWLTAWAYRREATGPIPHTLLVRAVRRVNEELKEVFPFDAPPQKRVNELVRLYEQADRHALVDRQVMLLMMAGDYQRLGFRQWSHDCLTAALEAARSDALWERAASDGSLAEKNARAGRTAREIEQQRAVLAAEAELRMSAARAEIGYLVDAARHLRDALARQDLPADRLRRYIYLAGEFDRRTGRFARAHAWLSAAAATLDTGPRPGVEVFAPEQAELVRQALGQAGHETVPANPEAATDAPLLDRLAGRIAAAPRGGAPADDAVASDDGPAGAAPSVRPDRRGQAAP